MLKVGGIGERGRNTEVAVTIRAPGDGTRSEFHPEIHPSGEADEME